MKTNTPTPRIQKAWDDAFRAPDLGAAAVARACFAEGQNIERDLSRVTAERDQAKYEAVSVRDTLHSEQAKATEEIRWRNAEIEHLERRRQCETDLVCAAITEANARGVSFGSAELCKRVDEQRALRARNAELVAELRAISCRCPIMGSTGDYRSGQLDALEACSAVAKKALARAESATPAKQSPAIDAESLIAACIPGGSICDPQQVADAIREYLRPQEPCGGRCGDPECDLDTNGVTMRTPAPHADTVRAIELLAWCIRQMEGESGASASYWEEFPEYRQAVLFLDARKIGGTP